MAIDFKLRDFSHPLSIFKLRQTLEKTQWMSASELRAYQSKQLQTIVKHAAKHVPYYRQLFEEQGIAPDDICCVEDLSRLPILDRASIVKSGAKMHADRVDQYHPKPYTTSGTTGQPLQILLDKSANVLEFVYYWRHWSWGGYRLGDRIAELGTLHFLNRSHLDSSPSDWQPALRRLMLNSSMVSTRHVKEMAQAMERYRPKFIKGMASTLFYFSSCLEDANLRVPAMDCAFSTGEMLPVEFRAKISKVLGCPVLDSYGHMERTVAISQCLEGGYHVNSDYGILEFTDPRPSQHETNLSSALGTSLYNKAMPLLRYDIGDTIETFDNSPQCPCGRSLPLVKAIHGRTNDIIVTPDGRYLTAIFVLPEQISGTRFVQFVQTSQTDLLIRVIPGTNWSPHERRKLETQAVRLVGKKMRVKIEEVRDADVMEPNGKRRVVISQISN
jgi:phenylacetate-coenzyme A ligase PaaK-like adenylate-forming protein